MILRKYFLIGKKMPFVSFLPYIFLSPDSHFSLFLSYLFVTAELYTLFFGGSGVVGGDILTLPKQIKKLR
jgi:hypothetical protein